MAGICRNSRRHGATPFLGRLFLSFIFILSGVNKILDFDASVQSLKGHGVLGAEIYIVLALLLEIVGGVLILLGYRTRFGVAILLLFLFPVTFVFHSFWLYEGTERVMQMANFLKNLAIFGGLLLLGSFGPGALSVDGCLACTEEPNQ